MVKRIQSWKLHLAITSIVVAALTGETAAAENPPPEPPRKLAPDPQPPSNPYQTQITPAAPPIPQPNHVIVVPMPNGGGYGHGSYTSPGGYGVSGGGGVDGNGRGGGSVIFTMPMPGG